MTQTMAIFFATTLVVLATLIPTYIISKRSAVSEDDWAVADRSLPIYVVIGTQFASAMGGGILVGHLGNAYLNGVAILIYGFLTALPFFFVMIPAKWLRQNNFTIPASLAISAFLAFLSFVWAVYMGMSISTMNTELAQNTATGWFMSQLPLPLLAAFAALVFAVMMSTVSSGAQSVVVNITRDILAVIKPDISSDKMLKLSRTLSLVTMVVAVLMCLVFTDTLTWLVATYAFSAATLLCPIYVGYIYRNKKFITTQGLIASMIAGCVGCAVAMVLKTTINYAVMGIAASFVALMVVSALTKGKATKNEE